MGDCAICSDPLPDDYTVCYVCNLKYHFECSNVWGSTWNRWGMKTRETWKCKDCRIRRPSQSKDTNVPSNLIGRLHKEFLEKLEQSIKLQFVHYEQKFGKQLDDFKNSVEIFSKKIDDCESKIKTYTEQVSVLKTSHENLENSQIQLENLEQCNRNRNVRIDGIPEMPYENMAEIIGKLSELAGVPIDIVNDVQAMYREPTKRGRGPNPVVVQFRNKQTRDYLLMKCKQISIKSNDFDKGAPSTNVYVNEHLTPYNKKLLYHAKTLREQGWKYVWTVDGKIFVRKSEGDRRIQVMSLEHVNKLIGAVNGENI